MSLLTLPATALLQQDPQPNTANLDNSQWYYDTLDANDQIKIQETFDIAIRKQIVIGTLLVGLVDLLVTPIMLYNGFSIYCSMEPYNILWRNYYGS